MKIHEMFRKLLAGQTALPNDAVDCGLFNDALNILVYIASNYRMINEYWTRICAAGSSSSLIEESNNFSRETDESHEKLNQYNSYIGWDLNIPPPEYKSKSLLAW
jgi:hypothetical protein